MTTSLFQFSRWELTFSKKSGEKKKPCIYINLVFRDENKKKKMISQDWARKLEFLRTKIHVMLCQPVPQVYQLVVLLVVQMVVLLVFLLVAPLVPLLPDGSEATAPVHPIFCCTCSCSCCPFTIFILINRDSLSLILSISEESWSVQKRLVSLMVEDGSMNIIKARKMG